ncbi:MAG: U32 family peptidase, partial [Clostridia bacterium]|nr:U32 family peptidase [Clostridia bacterium]
VILPPVIPDSEEHEVEAMLYKAKSRGARRALVSSLGAIALAKRQGFIPVGDFRLNCANRESADVLYALGISHLILSPELSPARASRIGGGYIVYGRIPLMLTERCFVKETVGCASCGKATLTDRRGVSFPVLRTHRHRALVFNSLPTYVCDKKKEMDMLSPLHLFLFTDESADVMRTVMKAAKEGASLPFAVRRLFK